jgi:signal peptidase I
MCAEVDCSQINLQLRRGPQGSKAVRPIQPVKTSGPVNPLKRIFVLAVIVTISLASYYLISRYVVSAVIVQGRSMNPTLNDGERCFLNRVLYKLHDPQRGDLVVIHDPGHNDYAVKRIVGMPTDLMKFARGGVYLNGSKLAEPYLAERTTTNAPENQPPTIHVSQSCFYVLGDNRSNSEDSRTYGPVHRSRIVGKLVY